MRQNDVEAAKWYRLAAEQGDADAQFNLGLMYDDGKGVPQDDVEAVKWYRLAAEQDDADAQFNLGVMYAQSEGVPKDYVLAHMWFSLAAGQGAEDAVQKCDLIEKFMTASQIAEAHRLAREWKQRPARS